MAMNIATMSGALGKVEHGSNGQGDQTVVENEWGHNEIIPTATGIGRPFGDSCSGGSHVDKSCPSVDGRNPAPLAK